MFLLYYVNLENIKGRVPAPLPRISTAVIWNLKSDLERGKVKRQRVLQLTLLTSALLPSNCFLKLDVLFTT